MEKKYAAYDLHLHSLWSYDACTPPEYYFSRAKELNLRAFAVTDHHNFDAFEEVLSAVSTLYASGFPAFPRRNCRRYLTLIMNFNGNGAIRSAVFCRSAGTTTLVQTARNSCVSTVLNGLSQNRA